MRSSTVFESHLVGENAAANVARRRESNRRRLARVPVDVQRTFRIVRGKRAPQRVRRERARPAPNVERIFLRIAAFGRGGGAASLAAHHPPDRAALIGPRRGNEFGEIALERWRIAGRSSGVVHVAKRGVSPRGHRDDAPRRASTGARGRGRSRHRPRSRPHLRLRPGGSRPDTQRTPSRFPRRRVRVWWTAARATRAPREAWRARDAGRPPRGGTGDRRSPRRSRRR